MVRRMIRNRRAAKWKGGLPNIYWGVIYTILYIIWYGLLSLLLILNTMILARLTTLGLAGMLELHGAPGSKSGFHRTGLDWSLNPVQSSPKRSLSSKHGYTRYSQEIWMARLEKAPKSANRASTPADILEFRLLLWKGEHQLVKASRIPPSYIQPVVLFLTIKPPAK